MTQGNSGFSSNARPKTTDWAEHGASGDVSTGRRLKYVQDVPNKIIIDVVDSSITFIGEASPGTDSSSALWRIKKITTSGSVTSIELAGGEDAFESVWDDRASLSYS